MGVLLIERLKWAIWIGVAGLTLFSMWTLEQERQTVDTAGADTAAGPITLYQSKDRAAGPLIVVSHGFAGSRQMMQYIARDLARSGFLVVSFDYIGHGRNPALLSPDVTRIEGTTQQLVAQTKAVFAEIERRLGRQEKAAFLGHSMATDIIIRAAQDLPQVQDIVAISMYSEAVTPASPRRLLVVSGEWEERLRRVGRDVVAQVGGTEIEGETVRAGDVTRRAVYTPNTEHVAVLFARATLDEVRVWLSSGFGVPSGQTAPGAGGAILIVLMGVVVLTAPLLRVLPRTAPPAQVLPLKTYLAAVVLPIFPAGLGAAALSSPVFGVASFAGLFWFFALWGGVAFAVLWRAGHRFSPPSVRGVGLFLIWALIVFAVALDRYAAAFLPSGPRIWLMATLLPATVLYMLTDRALAGGAPLWRRLLARTIPVLALSGAMLTFPENLGLLFTVLPVLVLFFVVYGTMGTLVARRSGAETAAVAQAVVLAWALAASTPIFAG